MKSPACMRVHSLCSFFVYRGVFLDSHHCRSGIDDSLAGLGYFLVKMRS